MTAQMDSHMSDVEALMWNLEKDPSLRSTFLNVTFLDRAPSFDGFRAQFTANALGIQGSGWSILAWDALGQRLVLEQVYDHQGNLAPGTIPLLLLDMWEHAFYLQYRNVKQDYVEAWWNVANWADVARRFEQDRPVVLP